MGNIDHLIALSRKAGRIASGEFAVEKSVRGGQAALVIIAEDASGNTKKKFHNMCTYYKVQAIEYSTKQQLGHLMGLDLRSVAAVEDEGFARSMCRKLPAGTADGGSVSTDVNKERQG